MVHCQALNNLRKRKVLSNLEHWNVKVRLVPAEIFNPSLIHSLLTFHSRLSHFFVGTFSTRVNRPTIQLCPEGPGDLSGLLQCPPHPRSHRYWAFILLWKCSHAPPLPLPTTQQCSSSYPFISSRQTHTNASPMVVRSPLMTSPGFPIGLLSVGGGTSKNNDMLITASNVNMVWLGYHMAPPYPQGQFRGQIQDIGTPGYERLLFLLTCHSSKLVGTPVTTSLHLGGSRQCV